MSFALAVGLALLGVSLMLVTVIVLLVRARLHEIRREGNVTMSSGPARHDMTVPLAAASGRDKAPPPGASVVAPSTDLESGVAHDAPTEATSPAPERLAPHPGRAVAERLDDRPPLAGQEVEVGRPRRVPAPAGGSGAVGAVPLLVGDMAQIVLQDAAHQVELHRREARRDARDGEPLGGERVPDEEEADPREQERAVRARANILPE